MPKTIKDEMALSSLGDADVPTVGLNKSIKKQLNSVKSSDIQAIHADVMKQLATCKTHREMLELEVNSLAECVGIARALFLENPMLDNSYQLTALINARKAALAQLEKMKDPEEMLSGIEQHIRGMFTDIVKAMASEMDKTRRELLLLLPDDKPTVDDLFDRMMNTIQPETQNIYNDLRLSLKKILGIRG